MDAIFFPRQDYPVQVCTHRYGKSMTYTEQSDQFRDGAEDIVSYAVANGIKVGVFWGMSQTETYHQLALPYVNNGQMWIDAYCNPTGSNGGTVTREAYEAQRDSLFEILDDWFGIRPLCMSYAYGNQTYTDYVTPDFLAARNSGKTGGTPYGVGYGNPNDLPYSMANYKTRASTSRWYDDAKGTSSFASRLQQLESDVEATKLNGGWYNNFTHWHNVINDGNLATYKDYLDLLEELNEDGSIYFAGYGEATAYLIYRQLITKAVMYSPKAHPSTQLFIRLEAENTLGINTDLLVVPISVKFSTVGTPLAGKTITSDCNLVSLGGGDYIVEIPYTGRFPYAIINGS